MLTNKERTNLIANGVIQFTVSEAVREEADFKEFIQVLVNRLRIVEQIALDVEKEQQERRDQREPAGEEAECDCPACSGDIERILADISNGDATVKVIEIPVDGEIPDPLAALLKAMKGV